MKILLIGSPGVDPTLRHFGDYLRREDCDFTLLDLQSLAAADCVEVNQGKDEFSIACDGLEISISGADSIYQRAFVPSTLAESKAAFVKQFLSDLFGYLANSEQLVVNPPWAACSNSCKPVHMKEIAAAGFKVPVWRVYGDAELARREVEPDGTWINKGCSSIRSVAVKVDRDLYSTFDQLRVTPALFQRFVDGANVRMHGIGKTSHALELTCGSLDYRYLDAGDERKTREVQPPEHIRLACLEYMLREKSQFIGFDFRVDAATEDWWLLEANPMPGFDFYDRLVDRQISLLLKRLLTGEIPPLGAEVIEPTCGGGIISGERLPRVSG